MAVPDSLVQFGLIVDLSSGALFLLLGILVALVQPHRLANAAFATLSGAMGIAYIFANLGPDYLALAGPWVIAVYLFAALLGTVCLFVIAREFPNELAAGRRRAFVLPMLLCAGAFLFQVGLLAYFVRRYGLLPFSGLSPKWFVFGMLTFWAFLGAFLLLLLVLAQRIPGLEGAARGRARRQVALVSLALLPYVALASAGHTMVTFQGFRVMALGYGVLVLLCLVLGALWFRNAARAAAGERRLFHGVALACFALPLLGAAFVVWTSDWNRVGVLGLSRVAGVAVLGYAIVRQGLFDIDVRLKWTLSRGSLAGVFIAVFFIVTELLQDIIGGTYGVVAGIGAAGLLSFALSPLQRMSERAADAAMPNVRAKDPAYLLHQKRETYRDALLVAWSDGQISAKEMRMLFRLRQSLGLPARDIAELEREVTLGAVTSARPGRRLSKPVASSVDRA